MSVFIITLCYDISLGDPMPDVKQKTFTDEDAGRTILYP